MTHPNSVAAAPELVCPLLNGNENSRSIGAFRGRLDVRDRESCRAKTCDFCFLSRRMVTALQKAVGPTARTESAI